MAKLHIKVEPKGLSFYSAVIRDIWHALHVLHMDKLGDLVIQLQIDGLAENHLLLFNGNSFSYTWYDDWDEGAETVVILGFMFVDEIEMVDIKWRDDDGK